MSDTHILQTKTANTERWVAAWVKAGDALEKIRHQNVKHADTAEGLRSFTGSVLHVLRTRPAAQPSSLVEQQRIFNKLRVS
jgi:hypothetical protein